MHDNDPIQVYDARWEVSDFDDAAVRRLFEATFEYGRGLGADTVTLARDARLAAGHVLEVAVDAAMHAGYRTFVCPHPISTPHAYYLSLRTSRQHAATLGLMITASHNPRDYIGVKFTVPGVQAIGLDCGPKGGLREVRRLYHSGERFGRRDGGTLALVDTTDEYIAFSMQCAGVGAGQFDGMGVVLDAMNGAAGPELYAAMRRAGAVVHARRLIPDGTFPTGSPNPTSIGKMKEAVQLAAERGADAVVGLDGDGDRIVFGTARGILNAGFVAVAILRACGLEQSGGQRPAVLYDPKVNPLALEAWARLGVTPTLFRNGHSQIKERMRQVGAVAAAEESGHYYHRITLGELTTACENSVLTAMLVLGALHADAKLADALWSMQDRVRTTGEFNYQFDSDDVRDRAMARLVQMCVDDGATTTTATPDGVDLEGTVLRKGVRDGADGIALDAQWYSGYVRVATNERCVVRSYFSAPQADVLARIEAAARDVLAKEFGGRVIE